MTQVHHLDNGLTIVLVENHAAPVISYNILFRVGSAVETRAEAGICHVIEHMLFKGTPSQPVGEIARAVEAAGGEINAYTSFDQTVYYINMASRYADEGLRILTDAVLNPLFDGEELSREAEVICEEIRRGKDNPNHEISEQLFAQAYGDHPYGYPIIGYDHTVNSFTHNSLSAFFKKWYIPANCVMIVVGDFEPKSMLAKISAIYKNVPTTAKTDHSTDAVMAQPSVAGPTFTHETADIQATYLAMSFPIPHFTDRDTATLDLLSQILSGGESSRMEQVIKEKKRLVQQIYTYPFTPKGAGLFIVGGLLQAKNLQATVAAVWEEISKVYHYPVTESELDRAKLNLRSNRIYEKETVGGEGSKYASFLAISDDVSFEEHYYRWMDETTIDDILDAAKRYLKPDTMTGIAMTPRDATVKTADLLKTCAITGKAPAEKTAITFSKKPTPQVATLPNGLKLVVIENHRLPLVSVCLANLGGLRFENASTNGINTMISQLLTKGTRARSALQIAEEIDAMAGSLGAFSGRNTLGVKGEFLSEKINDALDLFLDVVSNPTFPSKEVAKEKSNVIEAIKNQDDQLASQAFYYFCRTLYGDHPYGMRTLGSIASIKQMQAADIARYYARALQPKGAVMTVVGDVKTADIVKRMGAVKFGKGAPLTMPKVGIPSVKKPQLTELIKAGKQQAHIVLGFLGSKFMSPDYYPLVVMNEVLAGQGGRLFIELRDKLSLAYTVSSSLQMGIDPGFFSVYIGTDPSKVTTAIDGIRRELKLITEKLVSKDELARAQEHLIGTHALDQQRLGSLSSSYTFNLLYGMGIKSVDEFTDKVATVTREQILKIAQKYFRFDREILSIVKP